MGRHDDAEARAYTRESDAEFAAATGRDDIPLIGVSRHPAARAWTEGEMGRAIQWHDSVEPADVAGKIVVGNVPLHIAAAAAGVVAIEFSGAPPRGVEYSAAEMVSAGARLRSYRVISGAVAVGLEDGAAAIVHDACIRVRYPE